MEKRESEAHARLADVMKEHLPNTFTNLKTVTRCIVYVVAVLIIYGLYSPLLAAINPSLSGLVFIPVILWIFWMIFKSVTTLTTGE